MQALLFKEYNSITKIDNKIRIDVAGIYNRIDLRFSLNRTIGFGCLKLKRIYSTLYPVT